MTYDFLINIKKPNYSFADQISQLLYVFAIVAFSFFFYQNHKAWFVYLPVIIAIIICWIFSLLKRKKTGKAYFRFGLMIAVIGWLVVPQRNIFMAVLYAIAAILEKQVKFPEQIGFSETEISFNSFPKRTIQWDEVSNIIIKDGLITIDKRNNKIYQKEIEGYVTKDVEDEFNEFCRKQIAVNSKGN